MKKTLLYRWFGLGKFPEDVCTALQGENIRILDEGIRVVVYYHKYKGHGKYFLHRKTGFSGSIALTSNRLIAFAFSKRLVNVQLEQEEFDELDIQLDDQKNRLTMKFDVSVFDPKATGMIELRFYTEKADDIYQIIKAGRE